MINLKLTVTKGGEQGIQIAPTKNRMDTQKSNGRILPEGYIEEYICFRYLMENTEHRKCWETLSWITYFYKWKNLGWYTNIWNFPFLPAVTDFAINPQSVVKWESRLFGPAVSLQPFSVKALCNLGPKQGNQSENLPEWMMSADHFNLRIC